MTKFKITTPSLSLCILKKKKKQTSFFYTQENKQQNKNQQTHIFPLTYSILFCTLIIVFSNENSHISPEN